MLFLEKLENSKGFQNFEKKSNRPHTNKLTLIPSKSVLKLIESQLLELHNFYDNENNDNLNFDKTNIQNENLDPNNITKKNISDEKILKDFNENIRNTEDHELKNLLSVNDYIYDNFIYSNLDHLKDTFLRYSKLGENINSSRIGISSFMKFLKDCGIFAMENKEGNNNPISKDLFCVTTHPRTPSKYIIRSKPTKNISKSPVFSDNIFKKNEIDSKNILNIFSNKSNISQVPGISGKKINDKKFKNSSFYGPGERKISDSEVNVIYSSLIRLRNIDNSGKIKHQFDKNLGFSLGSSEISKFSVIEKKNIFKSGKSISNNKMDFYMFIKSFELIAIKLFPEFKLNMSIQKLFSEVNLFLINCFST